MTRDSSSTTGSTSARPVAAEIVAADANVVTAVAENPRERLLGGIYAFSAYLLWGFLPLYFLQLAPTGPWELVAWRIVLSLVFCAFLITVTRSWRPARSLPA